MTLCIIPARGGSKRIPRKNIRSFLGRPMIAWPIATALQSGLFEHVIVSTDDEEIAKVAREHGAEVPFMRPAELADDHTGTGEVVAHAIREMQHVGWRGDAACCLYATAPFTTAEHLRAAHNKLVSGERWYVFAACPYPHPIQRAFRQTSEGVEMFFPKHQETRSQDLEQAWHDAGQFYWGRAEAWLEQRPVFAPGSAFLPLNPAHVQDIDTEEDWQRAEFLMEWLRKRRNTT